MSKYSCSDKHEPYTTAIDNKGKLWIRASFDDPNVIQLGFAPKPRNQWEGFIHHILHGLIMRYPLWNILMRSWLNRKSFLDNDTDEIEHPSCSND